ncbi:uncharacterized protein AB675_10134 [Cyphellophora attinorum]|uniref:Uncharacterized protein n=1 Tax=Cyphellophora attinorum TaxID=1664694 RepID=A0A0N1H3U3_9EURO|nr:uncharacterized protein AB675_10134 [Phialophora attinorum]KPI35175.1 hypothetical protein AB675_10134 [Phialophora attinorum]
MTARSIAKLTVLNYQLQRRSSTQSTRPLVVPVLQLPTPSRSPDQTDELHEVDVVVAVESVEVVGEGSVVVAGSADAESVVVAGSADAVSVVVAGVADAGSVVVAGAADVESVVVAGAADGESVVVAGAADGESVVVAGAADAGSVVVAGAADAESVVVAGSAVAVLVVVAAESVVAAGTSVEEAVVDPGAGEVLGPNVTVFSAEEVVAVAMPSDAELVPTFALALAGLVLESEVAVGGLDESVVSVAGLELELVDSVFGSVAVAEGSADAGRPVTDGPDDAGVPSVEVNGPPSVVPLLWGGSVVNVVLLEAGTMVIVVGDESVVTVVGDVEVIVSLVFVGEAVENASVVVSLEPAGLGVAPDAVEFAAVAVALTRKTEEVLFVELVAVGLGDTSVEVEFEMTVLVSSDEAVEAASTVEFPKDVVLFPLDVEVASDRVASAEVVVALDNVSDDADVGEDDEALPFVSEAVSVGSVVAFDATVDGVVVGDTNVALTSTVELVPAGRLVVLNAVADEAGVEDVTVALPSVAELLCAKEFVAFATTFDDAVLDAVLARLASVLDVTKVDEVVVFDPTIDGAVVDEANVVAFTMTASVVLTTDVGDDDSVVVLLNTTVEEDMVVFVSLTVVDAEARVGDTLVAVVVEFTKSIDEEVEGAEGVSDEEASLDDRETVLVVFWNAVAEVKNDVLGLSDVVRLATVD